ncbi:MAG TPA: DedA family protein [Gemmatimonadaceae bacterium]|jgi:membrane protein DedA with SNARE-associated domain|nr:DedA family protein [Gemmatimonadaceae bacterium]
MLETLTYWLGALPLGSLYFAIGVLSAFENFFPPFPSDAVIAFGSFLAARAHGSPLTVFLLGWMGNIGGAGVTYALGRRFGAKAFLRKIERYAGPDAEDRIGKLYARYGFMGLFVSRFLPGVRAIVPPFAGAIRLPAFKVMSSIATASAVWFALITFLAFRAGDNWELLQRYLVRSGKVAGAIAIGIVVLTIAIWLRKRKQKRSTIDNPDAPTIDNPDVPKL